MSVDAISAASTAALGELTSDSGTSVPAEPTPEQTPAAAPEGSSVETPSGTDNPAGHAKVPEPTPEREFEITYRGQLVKLPESEVVKLASKGHDYTQKTMELAEARRAFEAERATQVAELQRQFLTLKDTLTNPDQMRDLVLWAAQQQGLEVPDGTTQALPVPVGVSPQQVQQLVQTQLAEINKKVESRIAAAQYASEVNRLEQEYKATVNSHIDGLLKNQFQSLQDVDGVADAIKTEVGRKVKALVDADPNREVPVADVLKMVTKAAEARHARIEARITARLKEAAVKQAQLVNTGIQPAGGGPPKPQPGPTPKLGSKELLAQVYADLGVAVPVY